jgi:hypothetical protein
MYSRSGVHTGGTDPNAGLHTTVKVWAPGGVYLNTIHVNHDPNNPVSQFIAMP